MTFIRLSKNTVQVLKMLPLQVSNISYTPIEYSIVLLTYLCIVYFQMKKGIHSLNNVSNVSLEL